MDLLYGIANGVSGYMDAMPGFFSSLVCIVVTGVPLTLLHELGHAVTARDRLGGDVEITVGNAAKVADLRLGGISASISALQSPFGAAGSASFDATKATARDILWIAVSGPVASLIAAIFAAVLYSAAPVRGIAHDLLWVAVMVSVFGFLNLVPFKLTEKSGTAFKTDGRLALDALKVLRELR